MTESTPETVQPWLVSRDTSDPCSTPFLPQERLSLDDALAAFTVGATWADHRDEDRGVLRVGARADLPVFDRDPYLLDAAELASVRAVAT
jgi:hypothetical protein